MPWNRLRVTRPSDTALRRHSTLDPANIANGSQETRNSHDGAMDTVKNVRSASPLRNSIDPAGAANDASFGERPESPPLPTARQQRFSILKFRHASDSQLSRTAKEQAQAAASPPPMPDGKQTQIVIICNEARRCGEKHFYSLYLQLVHSLQDASSFNDQIAMLYVLAQVFITADPISAQHPPSLPLHPPGM